MLNEAIKISKLAGDYLLKNFKQDLLILKERGMSKEIVTKYDKEADKIIINEIEKNFKNHSILTEETGLIDKKSDYLWIVDSMDGSGNFANQNPFYSVSIALMHKNELIIGVIYAPSLNELYVAEKDKGSTLNGEKLKASKISNLDKSYIVTCEGGSKDNKNIANLYYKLYPKVKDLRKIGSAAIEGGLIASSRADGYVTFNISPWDVAATILVSKEAGCIVTTFDNKPWQLKNTDLVISNGKIHSDLLKIVNLL
ncbi:MAG: inositol monophosphatase family protein [Candidatus Woesearchaeota archaeon]